MTFEELARWYQFLWLPYMNEGWITTVTREHGLMLWHKTGNSDSWSCVSTLPIDSDKLTYRQLIDECAQFLHGARFPKF